MRLLRGDEERTIFMGVLSSEGQGAVQRRAIGQGREIRQLYNLRVPFNQSAEYLLAGNDRVPSGTWWFPSLFSHWAYLTYI